MTRIVQNCIVAIHCAVCLSTLSGALAAAQSAGAPAVAPAASPGSVRSQPPPRLAEVVYSKGRFIITANNASLNQILNEIAHRTGMTITGSIPDERVYGMYGPAATAEMLETLLEGTGANMMLTEATASRPAELTLTPRLGGPALPRFSAVETAEPEVASTVLDPQAASSGPGVVTNKIPQGSSSGDQASTDGRLTPQQRYARVQQLQQQQGTPK